MTREELQQQERWDHQRSIEQQEYEQMCELDAKVTEASEFLMKNGYIVLPLSQVMKDYNRVNTPPVVLSEDDIPF
jgi:hypothetical protein